jgi:hypothetical protein
VEGELTQICNSILTLLDQNLIPSATTGESKARARRRWCPLARRVAERGQQAAPGATPGAAPGALLERRSGAPRLVRPNHGPPSCPGRG